jgi:hypothetical protein
VLNIAAGPFPAYHFDFQFRSINETVATVELDIVKPVRRRISKTAQCMRI